MQKFSGSFSSNAPSPPPLEIDVEEIIEAGRVSELLSDSYSGLDQKKVENVCHLVILGAH